MDPQNWFDPEHSPELLRMTNARLGRTIAAMFMQFSAKTKGQTISPPEARILLRKQAFQFSSVDVLKPFDAPLKEILRLATLGRYSDAGKLTRAHLIEGAQGICDRSDADQFKAAKQKRQKVNRAAGKASGEKRSRAPAMQAAAESLIAAGRPAREIAGIVAQRFRVTPDRVRKVLKKKRA